MFILLTAEALLFSTHCTLTTELNRRQWLDEEMYGVWSGGCQTKR